MIKYNIIDLFAGCGGLLDGFLQTGKYNHLAAVEWEIRPVETLRKRLKEKWGDNNADESVIRFDMQRTEELLNGFSDELYGKNPGMIKLIGDNTVDMIVGGPPCQAYSVAGRISDKQNMKEDYRNYLFEYYLKIVTHFKPKLFVFENVPGMLSAMPDGTPIINLIKRDISACGYEIIDDIRKYAVVDASEFGVPQERRRVILVGLNKEYFEGKDVQSILKDFYTKILPKQHKPVKTVKETIDDLPKCWPLAFPIKVDGRKYSHSVPNCDVSWHLPRYASERDWKIFKLLADDLSSGKNKYADSSKLCELYNESTGANTKVHKYHVLRQDKPSTTILAHLHKDGLRFIHYDAEQARTITVREAARLQSFDDDFEFVGSQGDAYKMIGNAVPVKLAEAIANAVAELVEKY